MCVCMFVRARETVLCNRAFSQEQKTRISNTGRSHSDKSQLFLSHAHFCSSKCSLDKSIQALKEQKYFTLGHLLSLDIN